MLQHSAVPTFLKTVRWDLPHDCWSSCKGNETAKRLSERKRLNWCQHYVSKACFGWFFGVLICPQHKSGRCRVPDTLAWIHSSLKPEPLGQARKAWLSWAFHPENAILVVYWLLFTFDVHVLRVRSVLISQNWPLWEINYFEIAQWQLVQKIALQISYNQGNLSRVITRYSILDFRWPWSWMPMPPLWSSALRKTIATTAWCPCSNSNVQMFGPVLASIAHPIIPAD